MHELVLVALDHNGCATYTHKLEGGKSLTKVMRPQHARLKLHCAIAADLDPNKRKSRDAASTRHRRASASRPAKRLTETAAVQAVVQAGVGSVGQDAQHNTTSWCGHRGQFCLQGSRDSWRGLIVAA